MGKYLDMIRSAEKTHEQAGQDRNLLQGQRSVGAGVALVPGVRITWEGADLTVRQGIVDFLHAYRSETWAFCTCTDGTWCAVNTKHCTKLEST